MTVPGAGIPLPSVYPEAGGVAIVMVGVNGNIYYQFSDPDGAFVGFQNNGQPAAFRGNPFTINNPIPLDCGIRSCTNYFGGSIAQVYIRFSAYDGDTQPGGFDQNDISLILNGTNVGSWSGLTTEITNNAGTTSFGFATGFGNNTFNTGWFSSTNQTLLNNILTSGQTSTQVFDRDPNDNYWDFTRGNSLGDEGLRTIAPGYEFEKTADKTEFTAVGEVITYTYEVTNIGSVNINNLTVTDDKIPNVTCDTTTINQTTGGGNEEVATCTGTYVVTQQDYDAQEVVNIARAQGDPEYGSLGAVTDTWTATGPATLAPSLDIEKSASVGSFSTVGEVITYTYVVTNDGDATVSNIAVTDDRIPGTICTIASLVPQAPNNTQSCTAQYTVTQADIDAFINSGTQLINEAEAEGRDPNGAIVTSPVDSVSLNGPAATPTLTIAKSALQANFDAVDDLIQFEIAITNTGNVTWPAPPTITDDLVSDAVTCPAGPVAPGASITCTADYRIQQEDLDAEEVENIAEASITVGGVTETGQADVTVPAVVTTGLEILKRQPTGDATTFDAVDEGLNYEYVLTNTGNVTLLTPTITDDKVSASCADASIPPGGSITCTSDAPYLVTQEDLDAGEVTNTASAEAATQQGAPVESDETSLTINADQQPEITLAKTAEAVDPADYAPGLSVTYTYEITNSGNVTFTDPIEVTDDKFPGPIDCGSAPLAPGASRTCQATYTVTPADFTAGSVTNTATASDGTTTSNSDTATVPQDGTPGITLVKTPQPGSTFDETTDSITYDFEVTNTGETLFVLALQNFSIDDPKIPAITCPAVPVQLAPGEAITCTGTYSPITQAEVDAGEVVNTATASIDTPAGRLTSPSSTATVEADITPEMSLTKTGPASFGAVGSTVTYTFEITNETAQTISSASVTDPKIPGLVCSFTDIPPNGVVSCQGDYVVTQADLDSGQIDNTASATGLAPTGESLSATASETVTADPAAQVRALSLDKTANLDPFAAVGDVVTYSFAVTNTGTVTLSDIVVDDPLLGYSCTIATLAVTATDDTTCSTTYTITQADIDRGSVENTATATIPGEAPVPSTSTITGPARNAAFTIEKTASDDTEVAEGTVVTYSHVVTNTGNVTLEDVTLTDTHTSASGTTTLTFAPSNVIALLEPGDSVTLTTSYTVTQDDIDAGNDLTNTVNGSATAPAGVTDPVASDDEVVDLEDAAPAFSVVKTEDDGDGSYDNLPSTELFTFEVFNDGNVTLSGLTIEDSLVAGEPGCVLPDIAPGTSVTQCLNGDPLEVTYTITQGDIDRGSLINTVTVTDGTLTATDSVTLSGPSQAPAISMVKTPTSGANFIDVGDLITYDYVITNEGNVTLTGPFSVADDKTTVSCPVTPASGVTVSAPGNTLTCTATYAVTQADLDAGQVTNLATANVTQSVTPGGSVSVTSAQESATVLADQGPELSIDKRITPSTPSTFRDVGDEVSYDFIVTNSGNVTIPGPITVDDDQIGTGLACAAGPLAPGASVTCTHTWTADQPAIDAGQITNTASPVATFGGVPVPAGSDSVTALAVQQPELLMEKTFVSITNNTFTVNEVITYEYRVENTGNTTITTEPVVSDNVITNPADISLTTPATFPAGGLLPGEVLVYTGTYTVTVNDVELGSVTNTATASSDGTTSNPSSVTTPEDVDPALTIEKTALQTTFSALNDPIEYTYTVTNSSEGNGLIRPAIPEPITVEDDKFAATISCAATDLGVLDPDETTTCTATYFITQEDLDAGEVTNSAVAEATYGPPGNQTQVLSPADSVTVTGEQLPALTTDKAVIAGPNPAAAGDVLTYQITTENTGNQTLSGVEITDARIPALTCTVDAAPAPAPVTLEVGQSLVCEGIYTVTQEDIDAQELENTADVTATNPEGTPVTDSATTTHPLEAFDPEVTVIKDLRDTEPDAAFSAVGQGVVYLITVQNAGNITLDTIDVTDSLVPGTCTVGPLAPGEEDATCEFTYTVVQADIDRGFIDNTASAEAQPATPDSDPVTGEDTLTGDGPEQEPEFALNKVADLASFSAVGEVITYTYTVANTGNVTLTDAPAVTDDRIATVTCEPMPVGGLLPGEFIECTGTDTVTQDDLDAGDITNVASVSSPEAPFDPANPGNAGATETVPAVQSPAVTIEKVADDATEVVVGQVVTYSYTVTNTGNVRLTDVTLTDAHTSASGTAALAIESGGVIATLEPGVPVTLTSTYEVTQADIDAGNDLTNTVSLTAVSPDGSTPTASDDEVVTVAPDVPELEVIKQVQGTPGTTLGSTVTFEITVENTGNVTLTGLTLDDTLRRQDATDITPAPTPVLAAGDGAELSPGEVWTYEVSHVLTQADIDAGGLVNSATATGTAPDGDPVSDVSDNGAGNGSSPTPFAIPETPAVETLKVVAIPAEEVGEVVTFTITVENTGNVTLTDVAVTDDGLTRLDSTPLTLASGPTFAGATLGSGPGTLQVGEVASYTATYVLTQDDIDAGGVQNVATGSATSPGGAGVDDPTDTPAVNEITPAPAIDMSKALAAGGPTFDAVGDVLDYEFTVENTGNITLTDQIVIDDPLITDAGGTISCPLPPYAPGAVVVCTGSYTVTQDDIDAGEVLNSATASAGDADPVTDDETVPAQQLPAVTVDKVAEELPSEEFVTGREVSYTYTVENTGNVTLTEPVAISDNLIPDVTCPALPAGGLAPGATLECTGTYTITSEDVELASTTNLATASSGGTDSPQVSETIPLDGTPALTIVKDLGSVTDAGGAPRAGDQFAEVGDLITYNFTVTNTGTVAFARQVDVYDDHFPDPIACFIPDPATNPDLIANEVAECSAVYTVTQEDLDAGEVLNSAYAQTEYGSIPTIVTSPPETELTEAATDPQIEILKEVDSATYTQPGDVLTYTFTVTNTGNQTLTSIEVTDPLLADLDCSFATLAPGAAESCTGTLTITQEEMDAGQVENVASVEAITPQGGGVEDSSDPVVSTAPAVPSELVLVKSATPDPFGGVGSSITYGFALTNNGPFTLEDVTVTDPLVPGFSCTVASIAVGETNSSSCTMPYTVTQDDVDAGEITNSASATGTTTTGQTSEADDEITTPGPDAAPSIDVIKTAIVPATTVGSVVTYELAVENTGNVTLDVSGISDEMERIATGRPTFLTTPFVYASGDADTDDLLDVGEIWVYTATYEITQTDVNAGGVSNTATVTATDPNGTPVTGVSDDGVDGNGDANPTLVEIIAEPVLDVVKSISQTGAVAGDEVIFLIEAFNRGNVSILNALPSDVLTRRDGTDISAGVSAPVRVGPNATAQTIEPGESWQWEVSYSLTQEDVDAGGISNLATVDAEGPQGDPVSDVSRDDDPGDGNPAVDPTELVIQAAPGIETVKTVIAGAPTAAGDSVTFEIVATNIGNVTLSGVTLEDTLTNLDGTVLTPDSISPALDAGGNIGPDESTSWQVVYTLTQEDVDAGGIENTATATGTNPGGLTISDVSDDGDDGDGNALNDPTQVIVAPDNTLNVEKTASTPERVAGSLFRVSFTITVENAGNVTQENVQVSDDLAAWVVPAELSSVTVPVVSGFETASPNTGFDGAGDTATLAPGAVLLPGQTGTVTFTVEFDIADGSPAQDNVAEVTTDRVTVPVTAAAGIPGLEEEPDLLAEKSVLSAGPFRAGSIVRYEVTFTNNNTTGESGLTLVDQLPGGMRYVTDSATFNGAETPAPVVSGRTLRWDDIDLAPGETVTLRLSALLLEGAGEFTNLAFALDDRGVQVSNTAEATIDVAPEPVFDCGDVIGKVFDDRNGNGYQDPPPGRSAAVSNQEFYTKGKFQIAPEVVEQQQKGEPGIPGVRLVTVRGDIITTDEFGRYHVPCALLPAKIGSNFTLKLDERSLPTGYRVTTENPRVMRLTAGIMTELNFGAKLGKLVEVDLTAKAFERGTNRPSAALAQGVDGLVKQIGKTPTVLRVTYYRAGESPDLARARLRAVEALIRKRWRGSYKLQIETTIARVQ
ncbi:DUF7507 domain-containing protein [Vannielia sp. SX4]|uniref:DUF7507 domain-containing protein n=1 Tax=Vannielia sp. SX4 TaxID=3463852 RepID=UPI004058B416